MFIDRALSTSRSRSRSVGGKKRGLATTINDDETINITTEHRSRKGAGRRNSTKNSMNHNRAQTQTSINYGQYGP